MKISPLVRTAARRVDSFWDKGCAILPLFFLLACAHAAPPSNLNLIISSETAPSGATVQLKLSLAQPAAVSAGEVALVLDPTIFGPVTAIGAFSAAGDASGYATINGNHSDIHFASQSATLGSAAGMPLVVITVPTLAAAKPGTQATITADPSGSQWTGPTNTVYTVAVTPGTVTIGGSLSVSDVSPVSNLSAGAVVRIRGTGLTSVIAVQIPSVSLASVQAAGPQEIDLTLESPADLGGKQITVINPDGSQVNFFAAPPATPLATLGGSTPGSVFDGALPLFPTASYPAGSGPFLEGATFGRMAIANPNTTPVNMLLQVLIPGGVSQQMTLTIPAGGAYNSDFRSLNANGKSVQVFATAPLRMLQLLGHANNIVQTTSYEFAPFTPTSIPPASVSVGYGASAQFNWVTGTTPPQPQTVTVYGPTQGDPDIGFTVSFSTASGGNWLSVTPASGTTCQQNVDCSAWPTLTVSANPSGLAPGIYRGSITIAPLPTPFQPAGAPVSFPVSLTVTAAPIVNHIISSAYFRTGTGPNLSESFSVAADVLPGAFTVDVLTDSGGNWLSATPLSGATPAQVNLAAAPGNLGPGMYAGAVTVNGSGGGTLVIESTFTVFGGVQLLYPSANPVFALGPGEPPSAPQTVAVQVQCFTNCPSSGVPNNVTWTTTVSTHSGSNWLSAVSSFSTEGPGGSVTISVNPAGLAPGVYTGVVTLASDQAAPAQIPVALNVWNGPLPALSANPPAVSLTASPFAAPVADAADICTYAGSANVRLTAQATTSNGGNWLGVTITNDVTPSCGIQVSIDASHLNTGVYQGDVTISVQGQMLDVPVTLTIPPPVVLNGPSPVLGSVLNAASGVQGAIAPGEIITIHGIGLGYGVYGGTTFTLDSSGHVPTILAGTEVLINGKPAPVLYTSASQINAIVPYEAAGQSAPTVQVLYNGLSPVWGYSFAPAAPGIFTLDSTGAGPAAVLNQDNSVNGPNQPAARGSVIQLFATGIPVMGAVTGSITPAPVFNATPSVSVLIGGASLVSGGVSANILYAGPAPDQVAGLVHVNAVVPDNAPTGPAVPIVINVSTVETPFGIPMDSFLVIDQSQVTATIAVQ